MFYLRFCSLLVLLAPLATVRCAGQGPAQFNAVVIAEGLEAPWSLAFAPDGRLFVAERPGRIRVIRRDTLMREPWAVVPAHESAAQSIESGLMGLAVDPRFAQTGRVYVCFTESTAGKLMNRIAVLTERNGKGADLRVLVDSIPAGRYHNGCRLSFGPDGKLYATTGDAGESREQGGLAQSLESLAGKVLRINTDGSIPADNPFPRSYVFSLGHRNAQGLAWQPRTNRLFATEHGTGASGNNELNIIERGKNYGWPVVIGVASDARFINPIYVGENAPAGATFVEGSNYPTLRGKLVIATLSAQRLIALHPDSVSGRPIILIDKTYGRLRDVVLGPDNALYIANSNRDGRGQPGAADDRVIRLLPVRR